MRDDVRRAFVDTLPVLTGYVAIGIAFGILLGTKGYGPLWSLAMATIIYSGSMQFVTIELIVAKASPLTAAITSLALGARHLFYGLSMVDRYRGSGIEGAYMIYGLTDEVYALVCDGGEGQDRASWHRHCFLVTLLSHAYWVGGCMLGSLLGPFIPFDTTGIDFALTALFVTIVVEQWLDADDHRPAIVGLAASLTCLVAFGPDRFLIPSMIVIAAALLALRGRLEARHG